MGNYTVKNSEIRGKAQPTIFRRDSQSAPDHHEQTWANDIRLDLLYKVGRKASSAPEVSKMVDEIVAMTRQTLKASASSVLLIDEQSKELCFEFADGSAGGVLKQVRLSIQSGIAGWVARHGSPLVINNVAEDTRFFQDVDKATGFVTKSIMCAPLIVHGNIIGVVEVLNKEDGSDFNDQDLETLVAVAATAAIAIENSKLHQSVIDGYKGTIKALAAAIDAKDPYTCGHSQRVVGYALMAGNALSLSPEELEVLEYAGILHDIGKIGIADTILCKPGSLTDEEYCTIPEHPVIGAKIIDGIPFLHEAKTLVLHHHERYDGLGYPKGLKGTDIPLGARLLAVADSFDSMTTDRPYHAALSIEHAISELHRCVGTQFCRIAVEAFISGFEKGRRALDASGTEK